MLARAVFLLVLVASNPAISESNVRARDLGVPFAGIPGPHNAITDVKGVEVGHTTLISGDGELVVGKGPVRTGVTVIHPLGKRRTPNAAVAAGRAVINGVGEWTGMWLVDEAGFFWGPVALTSTGSIGIVHQAVVDWGTIRGDLPEAEWFTRTLAVVGETLDWHLNDVFGHHLKPQHVFAALDHATPGPVQEGNVGGGTGMVAYQFKGGIGTGSRIIDHDGRTFTVGVILQANHGYRRDLRIAGIPVGELITDLKVAKPLEEEVARAAENEVMSSLLILIATDCPLQPHQLNRLARRAALGVGRNGSTGGDFSGELVLAFSTTNTYLLSEQWKTIPLPTDMNHALLDALFEATVQAVEEALVNQLVASETMTGVNGNTIYALPHDRLIELLKKYNRYNPPDGVTDRQP